MTLTINDVGSTTKLTITNGKKTLLQKTGTIKSLLKFVFDGTKKENLKQVIMELQHTYPLMIGSDTKIKIKD